MTTSCTYLFVNSTSRKFVLCFAYVFSSLT